MSDMKTIGILNLQDVDNYGCVLGAYALLRAVRKCTSCHAELVDYRPTAGSGTLVLFAGRMIRRLWYFGAGDVIKHLKIVLHNSSGVLKPKEHTFNSEGERIKRFAAFRDKYLDRSRVCQKLTEQDHPAYNIYLVGSDVVWRMNNVFIDMSPMLLDFTADMNCKRISYAASFGDDPWIYGRRRKIRERYRRCLSRFDMISVREMSSVSYLSELYHGEIYCCMDPTLLFTASDYDSIADDAVIESCGDYIYVYMLNDDGSFFEAIDSASRSMELPIVCCSDQLRIYDNVIEYAEADGPSEFLKRIKNASLVITNSFHGVCFSILYHKRFFYVRRVKQAYKTEELLKKIGLTERCVTPEELRDRISEPIDYAAADERLDAWRKESMDYLSLALQDPT